MKEMEQALPNIISCMDYWMLYMLQMKIEYQRVEFIFVYKYIENLSLGFVEKRKLLLQVLKHVT